MQYNALNQSTIKVISTVESTINTTVDLAVQHSAKTNCLLWKKTGESAYRAAPLVPFGESRASKWSIGNANVYIGGENFPNSYNSPVSVDGVTYYGVRTARFEIMIDVPTSSTTDYTFEYPAFTVKAIVYDSESQAILTKSHTFEGKTAQAVQKPSSYGTLFLFCLQIYVPITTDDIVLGVWIEYPEATT